MSKRLRLSDALQTGYVIAYDGGSRHSFGGRPWPWLSRWAAQRYLDRSTTFQVRGGVVVECFLLVRP